MRGDQEDDREVGRIYPTHVRGSRSRQGMLSLRYLSEASQCGQDRVTCLRTLDDPEQSRPSSGLPSSRLL
jgi:hypothetical protein